MGEGGYQPNRPPSAEALLASCQWRGNGVTHSRPTFDYLDSGLGILNRSVSGAFYIP